MKSILTLISITALFFSCQKVKERAQENIILKAMTEGQWRVTTFTKAGIDKTTEFAAYRFQFRTNNTVEALNNGVSEKTGTWQADPAAKTIFSSFNNAAATLMLLNGTWQITRNSWTYVEASQTTNGEFFTLRLDK